MGNYIYILNNVYFKSNSIYISVKFIINESKRQRRENQNLHDYVVFATTGA